MVGLQNEARIPIHNQVSLVDQATAQRLDAGIDSMVSPRVFLDQTFGLRIPDAEASAEAFDTVSGIVQMLRKQGAE